MVGVHEGVGAEFMTDCIMPVGFSDRYIRREKGVDVHVQSAVTQLRPSLYIWTVICVQHRE